MKQLTTILDRMPVHTWRRPAVNTVEATLTADGGAGAALTVVAPEGVTVARADAGAPEAAVSEFFVPAAMATFLEQNANQRATVRVPDGFQASAPIYVAATLTQAQPALADDLLIEVGEGAQATVILRYMAQGGTEAEHTGRARVLAHRGAKLTLVVAQTLGNGNHTGAVEGLAETGAELNVIVMELGAKRALSSVNLTLAGEGAAANLDVLYLGEMGRTLDITTRVEHGGKKTVSAIRARGILLKGSKKTLRDTLDFVKGSSGAKGREEESVLLLSPDMRNISVPILLCGEDDVEGEHAASSGRLNDRTLFYLTSRGIDEAGAKKLLAQAAFAATVEKIPDAALQSEVMDIVTAAIEREGN